jgi:hypothetical protein
MGARVNFVFNDGTDHSVVLYSHWGADSWAYDIANAINHSAKRIAMDDTSYATRMMISYLISESVLEETGYGIYAAGPEQIYFDEAVMIDMVNKTVNDVDFSEFIGQAFLAENARAEGSVLA